jgi:ribosomal protein L4
VTRDKNENALRAFANLPTVSLITSNELNTYAIVKNDVVVFEKNVLSKIQEGIVS